MRSSRFFFLLVLCLGFLSVRVEGAETRWVITHEWKGRGPRMTEMFMVNGDKWRVTYRNWSKEILNIRLYNAGHELQETIYAIESPFPGFKTLTLGKGQYYLAIEGRGVPWRVDVKQYLSATEEWSLLQELQKPEVPLRKLAVWTGQGRGGEYTVGIPEGSWKLVCTATGKGRVKVDLTRLAADAGKPRKLLEMNAPMMDSTWVHGGGNFKVAVDGREDSAWRLEVLYP